MEKYGFPLIFSSTKNPSPNSIHATISPALALACKTSTTNLLSVSLLSLSETFRNLPQTQRSPLSKKPPTYLLFVLLYFNHLAWQSYNNHLFFFVFVFVFVFCILQRFRQAVRYGSVTQAHAPLEYILDLNGGYGRSSSRNGHRLSHEHLLVEQPQPPQVWFQAFLFFVFLFSSAFLINECLREFRVVIILF